ncbi:MAG: Co2+/Mg2+ efflux protein ApaG [Saprospiraceae bacterium]|nr:Co2+/Mg2+ efflux protein ApaG [Saprospiraceae bacterium]
METTITQGIRVSVETFYQEKHSSPVDERFVYAYRITIRNESNETVQLMRRHWYIRDSNNILREVEGEGVIGQQPVLEPGEHHEYVSWTNLLTDVGKMYGIYTMRKEGDDTRIDVQIPEFTMVAPYRLN